MKTEDLMVHDLVHFQGKVYEVVGLNSVYNYIQLKAKSPKKDLMVSTSAENVSGIEVTLELLFKNGWSVKKSATPGYPMDLLWHDEFGDWANIEHWLTKGNNDTYEIGEMRNICYVHELQQWIRCRDERDVANNITV